MKAFIVCIAILFVCFMAGCFMAAREADEAIYQVQKILEEMRSNNDD